MLRKTLKQGFSFKNTFSTSSFFEILNHGTKKHIKNVSAFELVFLTSITKPFFIPVKKYLIKEV